MGQLREVTREEAEAWTALANEHGFVNENGEIAVGRFTTADLGGGRLELTFITPLVAGLYTEDLRRKIPPIRFDRTAAGEIILPGRWWAHMFERTAEVCDEPADRSAAMRVARTVYFPDITLPADTDTMAFTAPDDEGHPVVHEALPPGGRIVIAPAT